MNELETQNLNTLRGKDTMSFAYYLGFSPVPADRTHFKIRFQSMRNAVNGGEVLLKHAILL